MKYLVAAFLLAAAPVSASGLSDPIVTPEVVVAEAESASASSDIDLLIAAVFLATLLTAVGVGY